MGASSKIESVVRVFLRRKGAFQTIFTTQVSSPHVTPAHLKTVIERLLTPQGSHRTTPRQSRQSSDDFKTVIERPHDSCRLQIELHGFAGFEKSSRMTSRSKSYQLLRVAHQVDETRRPLAVRRTSPSFLSDFRSPGASAGLLSACGALPYNPLDAWNFPAATTWCQVPNPAQKPTRPGSWRARACICACSPRLQHRMGNSRPAKRNELALVPCLVFSTAHARGTLWDAPPVG